MTKEELKHKGFIGINKEAIKTIFSSKKIFTQIAISIFLPLSIIILAHLLISCRLVEKIVEANKLSTDFAYFWVFQAAYLAFLLLLTLLSTAIVVYTVACIYSDRDVTYKKAFRVVPNAWKRLVLTFVCIGFSFLVYAGTLCLALFFWNWLNFKIYNDNYKIIIAVFVIILVLFYIGFVLLNTICQIANAVSVLESSHAFRAMLKGKNLVKGKRLVAFGLNFVLTFIFGITIAAFVIIVVFGLGTEIWLRVVIALVCDLVLMMLLFYGLVSQTVLYLVCKSHHRETISNLSLSTYLGAYLEENGSSQAEVNKDVQLGQISDQV